MYLSRSSKIIINFWGKFKWCSMIIMFHCDVLSNQNVIGNALMWVKNWDSCPQSGPLCSDTLSLSGDILLEPEHPLCLNIKFQGNLDLGQFIEIEKWDGGAGCSWGLKMWSKHCCCHYYFNVSAPYSSISSSGQGPGQLRVKGGFS